MNRPNDAGAVSSNASKTTVGGERKTSYVELENGIIKIKKHEVRYDQPNIRELDTRLYWLPGTPFTDGPITLASRPDLVQILFEALRGYTQRQSPSKTGHINVIGCFFSMLKMVEFCWIRGLYRLQDWTSEATDELPRLLGKGGWAHALNLSERVEYLIAELKPGEIHGFIREVKKAGVGIGLNMPKIAKAIGTNLSHTELLIARELIQDAAGIEIAGADCEGTDKYRPSSTFGMGAAGINLQLSWINCLATSLGDSSLKYQPFPSAWSLATRHGRPNGRTKNISPSEIAIILETAILWVEQGGVHILDLMSDAVDKIELKAFNGEELTYRSVSDVFMSSEYISSLEKFGGIEILGLSANQFVKREQTFVDCIAKFMTGCFCIISLLNARRRDEVLHEKIGLTQASMELVDESLELFLCWFYLEKQPRNHVPMYVGRATSRAVQRLQTLEGLTAKLASLMNQGAASPNRWDAALFRLPVFEQSAGPSKKRWYKFSYDSKSFFTAAFGKDYLPGRITPHMFRRGYGLIYLYRFEGPMLALAQKYGHIDPIDTITYVTNPNTSVGQASVREYGKISDWEIRSSATEVDEIEAEIAIASKERLIQMVESIINGYEPALGGFPKLISRMHQILGTKITYSGMRTDSKVGGIAEYLVERGHQFRPFWHGNCCAPSEVHAKAARCNPGKIGTSRENADPVTCSTCRYHHLVNEHVSSIENYSIEMRERLQLSRCSDLERLKVVPQLENIERLIVIYRRRLCND